MEMGYGGDMGATDPWHTSIRHRQEGSIGMAGALCPRAGLAAPGEKGRALWNACSEAPESTLEGPEPSMNLLCLLSF